MLKISIFGMMAVLALLQPACSPTATFSTARWTGGDAMPPIPSGVNLKSKPLSLGNKDLLFQAQKIEGVEVEGSYFKKISGPDGRTEFLDYRWMSKVPWSVRTDLMLMRAQKPFVLDGFLKSRGSVPPGKLVESPVLTVGMDALPQVLWKLVYEYSDGSLRALFLNKKYELVRETKLGSNMDALASVFPLGPLKSSVQEVQIHNIIDSQELSTTDVKITTESNLLALPGITNQLIYPTDDLRFSQVQALFYMTQTLQWFTSHVSFTLPFVLEAETQKGFPEKTNTAFYYQHKVRLGDGDGLVFEGIPMDPSVVTHESNHAIIDAVAGLPFEGEGGSLNEAFADFFAATILNNANMGEASYKKAAFKRTVENSLTRQEKNGGLYHDSGIISGLLWSLLKKLGPEVGTRIAWQTLIRLNPNSDFDSFQQALLENIAKQTPDDQRDALVLLKQRGWDL